MGSKYPEKIQFNFEKNITVNDRSLPCNCSRSPLSNEMHQVTNIVCNVCCQLLQNLSNPCEHSVTSPQINIIIS